MCMNHTCSAAELLTAVQPEHTHYTHTITHNEHTLRDPPSLLQHDSGGAAASTARVAAADERGARAARRLRTAGKSALWAAGKQQSAHPPPHWYSDQSV